VQRVRISRGDEVVALRRDSDGWQLLTGSATVVADGDRVGRLLELLTAYSLARFPLTAGAPGATIIVITHKPALAEMADCVIRLADGRARMEQRRAMADA
jgi:predicted ABC-type transport system involved in lysophospholipase L1 biosynthesis ATPase subunit